MSCRAETEVMLSNCQCKHLLNWMTSRYSRDDSHLGGRTVFVRSDPHISLRIGVAFDPLVSRTHEPGILRHDVAALGYGAILADRSVVPDDIPPDIRIPSGKSCNRGFPGPSPERLSRSYPDPGAPSSTLLSPCSRPADRPPDPPP